MHKLICVIGLAVSAGLISLSGQDEPLWLAPVVAVVLLLSILVAACGIHDTADIKNDDI